MEILTQTGGEFLSRWGHYLAGVTWVGLLYYFNFVQVPSFAALEPGTRNENIDKLVPRALWWFRWGALTLLTGLSILAFQENLTMSYFKTAPGMSIVTGILLAVVMFSNVWGVIWQKQKVVIASARGVLAGSEADPAAAGAGRAALVASRTNTLLSIPMLFFMGGTTHFLAAFSAGTGDGGKRAIYWLVTLLIVGALEANALMAPAAGSPRAVMVDTHRNTIISGFVLTVIFYAMWEILFGM